MRLFKKGEDWLRSLGWFHECGSQSQIFFVLIRSHRWNLEDVLLTASVSLSSISSLIKALKKSIEERSAVLHFLKCIGVTLFAFMEKSVEVWEVLNSGCFIFFVVDFW